MYNHICMVVVDEYVYRTRCGQEALIPRWSQS